jgi:putative transposase
MARFHRILSTEFPMHITARCNNKENFPVTLETAWDIFTDYLYLLNFQYGIRIHSFVMMSNHFHMICRDPNLNLSKAMAVFMRETSKEMARLSGRINRIWGDRFDSTVMGDPRYFLNAYKYDYRNPVTAKICSKVEEYPWSTIQILLGQKNGAIPLEYDETLFSGIEYTLDWLNESYDEIESTSIKTALSKKVFKFPRDEKTRYANKIMRRTPKC